MKIDRSRVRKSTSEIPAECQELIESIQQCSRTELLHELSKINSWTFGKCELLHWAQVLDLFDKILGAAAERSEENKWALKCDSFTGKDKMLLICILRFTSLLIEHSFSRHLYNSMEHLLVLLTSNEMNVVLEVLNLLYMFSKRSNFITRLKTEEKECLLDRLQYLAENWGGKENGFGLADCCKQDSEIPSSATTLHVEFHREDSAKSPNKDNNEVNPKSSKPNLHIIHIEHIDKLEKTPAEIMKSLKSMYYIPTEKEMWLFTHVRLATNFATLEKRLKCVQARLQALSVLVYANAIQDSTSNLLYNGILEELVEVVELNEPELTDIRCAALRTLTAIIHLDRNPQFPKRPGSRLNSIIDVTGASQYHGFLPVLVRNCIVSLTNDQQRRSKKRKHHDSSDETTETLSDVETNIGVNAIQALSAHSEYKFPVSLTTALFSFLYHLASYDVGGEALVSCGMMESLLEVINWQGYELDHITFVTRAVRVIDLITNIDMQAFQVHGGLTSFINRLDKEVNFCNDDQLYQFPAHNLDDNIPVNEDNTPVVELEYVEHNAENSCLPQRAALLKSLLNFLKKAFQDAAFAESIRHLMESPLPSALKNIIANAEYYGPSLFLLATDVVTVYVYQEPTVLPALQDNGLTNIVLNSLLMKEVPATREVLGSLPNVFSALCLNARGLELFARHRPFEKLFHILLSPLYLPAMRRRRSSEPSADTASNLGNAMDELMRHQPSLRQDATVAIVSLLEELVFLGSDPKFICWRPHGRAEPLSTTPGRAAPTEGSSDEEEEDEDETSTSSNAQTQNESNATQSPAGNERQLIPLIDYILNAMKFIDAILSNNSTDDHCREFVQKGGLRPLLRLLGLPNLPADCPVTNPAQSVATVCKSILNLAHEPYLFQEGLHQLSEVLDNLKPLCSPTNDTKPTMGGSKLLMELASAPDASAAFSSAQATPLLHGMNAAHGYVLMFVHVCRTGQPEIRNLSLHHWGKKEGSKVLKGLADLYTALVWESTLLLAYCSDDLIPSECDFTRESIEKLNQFFDRCETTQHVTEIPSNHSSGIDVGVVPMDIDGNEYSKSDSRNLKYIKPLLGASSRLGRALAELFGLLVKLCVGSPVRQRRGQNIITAPPVPTVHAKKVALALNQLLAKGLDCDSLPPCPTPKCRLTFLICSVGFTSPMLFDERRFPYYLMLKKFVSMGGQATFFKTFKWALGADEGPSDVNALPEGTLGFLDAWLTLLEKMVNPKTILESPHVVSTRPNATYRFDPIKYLIQIHRLAFDSIEKLWKHTPITSYGNRIADTILTILRHIYWGEKIIKEKLKPEDTRPTTSATTTDQPSTSNNGFVAVRDSEVNLRQLEDMGFSRENAIDALLHSSSVEQATDYLLSNPPQAARASTSAVDSETVEDDQVLQAIAMSLSDNSNSENPHATFEELQALLDEFTTSALNMCLDLLNKMPDLVHKTCELLVTIMKRNGKEYRDSVLQEIAGHILKNAMDIYSATVNKCPGKIAFDAMVDTVSCKRLANYTHLFILFYEVGFYYEMKLPFLALYGSETINLIIRLIKKAQHIIFRVFKNTRDIPEPKWLASSLLLVDAYLKVANRTDRKCKMHISTNRVWRWYDLVTGKWTHYSAANNLAINEAYWSGEQSVKITYNRKRYTITFPYMLQMNDETGNNRPIAMTLLSFTHPSCTDINEKVPKDTLFAELTEKEALRCTPVPSMPRFEKRLILKSCVNMLHMPLERDLLHSILQICVRFTREFKMAKEFVREGGVKCLLSIRHIADFGGFGVLATILIRHALEEPDTLAFAMEKVIRGRILTSIPPPYRDLVYLTRQFGAAVTRDPNMFFKVARNILRVDISACKPGDSLDVVLPIKAEPPAIYKAPDYDEPVSIQVICDLLDALLMPLFEKSTVGTKTSKKESNKPDTSTAGDSLASNIAGPSTSNATTSNTDKTKDSSKTSDEEVIESKPMLPKSVVLKILADAVISYAPIAELITEHIYEAGCHPIIKKDTSALAFIFDKILPETENLSDSDCSSMCRILIAALASANHSSEAQLTLVNEVKCALYRAVHLPESSEKHSQIQHICGIIYTMIDNCPMHPRALPNVSPVNNIIKILIRRGLFSDLAKISHFLDLSSPHISFTLNAALKPMESLSRSINMPNPSTTTVRGRRTSTGTREDHRSASGNPQHVQIEEDLENVDDGQAEATIDRRDADGERDRLEEIMEQILEAETERAVPMEGGPLGFNPEADPTEEMISTDSGESDSNPSDDNDEDGNNDDDNGADANIEDNDGNNDGNNDGGRNNGERRIREDANPWPRFIRYNDNRFSVPVLDENSGDQVIIHPLLLSRNTDSNHPVTRTQRTTRPRRYQYLFDARNPNPPVILQRLLGTHDPHAMANMMTANNILAGPAEVTREQARVVIMDNFGIIPSNEEQIDFVDQSGYMFGPSLAATLNYVPPVVHWWNMESKILDMESVFDCTAWICNRLIPILIRHRNNDLRLSQATQEKIKKPKTKPVAELSGQSGEFLVFNFDGVDSRVQSSTSLAQGPAQGPAQVQEEGEADASDSSDSVVIGLIPQLVANYPTTPSSDGSSSTRERENDDPQQPPVPLAPIAQMTDDLDRERTDTDLEGRTNSGTSLSDASTIHGPFLHDDLDLELESMEVRRLSRIQQSARFTDAWAAQANQLGNQSSSPDSDETQSHSAREENSSRETENSPREEENTPIEPEQSPRGVEEEMERDDKTLTEQELQSILCSNLEFLAREMAAERAESERIGIVPDCTTTESTADPSSPHEPENTAREENLSREQEQCPREGEMETETMAMISSRPTHRPSSPAISATSPSYGHPSASNNLATPYYRDPSPSSSPIIAITSSPASPTDCNPTNPAECGPTKTERSPTSTTESSQTSLVESIQSGSQSNPTSPSGNIDLVNILTNPNSPYDCNADAAPTVGSDNLPEPRRADLTPSVISISSGSDSSVILLGELSQNNAAEQNNTRARANAPVQANDAVQSDPAVLANAAIPITTDVQSNAVQTDAVQTTALQTNASVHNNVAVQDNATVPDSEEFIIISDTNSETSGSSRLFESPRSFVRSPGSQQDVYGDDFHLHLEYVANRRGFDRIHDEGSSSSSSSDMPSQAASRSGTQNPVVPGPPISAEDDETGEGVDNPEPQWSPGLSSAVDEEEIPDGVDPSFLEALPPEIRREVLEQQRLISLQQRLASTVTEEAPPDPPAEAGEAGERSSSSEGSPVVSPEFLAALPPALQEEVLSQQRFDQQRQAAARAPPNEPVDAHAFFQTLQPSLRNLILADMEESQISALPPELAAEAQNLRRDWYARNRQIAQERFLQSNLPTIIRQNRAGRGGHRPISIQRGAWSQWGREFMASTAVRSPSTQVRIRGRQLVDHEGISCLLILLFTDDTHLNKLRLHRVIRNLCYHAPTREWIINALLSIIDKSVNTKPDESLNKPARKVPRAGPLTSKLQTDSRHLNTGGHWLTIRMEAALGCAANVFLINKTSGKKAVGGHQAIGLHPQAAPVVCRNTLDLFTALAKAFPCCLLPIKLFREEDLDRNAVPPVKLNAPGQPDFWDILLKLDSAGSKKGKSIAKSTNFYSNSGEQDNLSFENTVFGKLLNMLGSPVVNRNTQLTDNLLKLLSVTTAGMPDVFKPYRPKTSKIKTEVMSAASVQALSLAVSVITYKNCSEEGLEFITTLLLNLASASQDMTHMILELLLDGAAEIGMKVEEEIKHMLEDLKHLISCTPKKKDDKEGPSTSKGVIYNRFTKEQVIIMASAKVKAACELQLPSMVPLTSKSSSQIFFLRVLRVIVQIRNSIKNNIKRNRLEADLVALSEQLRTLESLWETLSACLLELEHAPDHHAVLVLQPAVEAFFLVHSPQQGAVSYKDFEKETATVNEVEAVVDVHQQSDGDAPVAGEAAASAHSNIAAAQSIVTALAGAVLSRAGTSSSQDESSFSSSSTTVAGRQVSPEQQKFLAFAEKHRTVLNQILRQSTAHLADGPFAVLVDHTRILDFDIKRRYFRTELERMDHGIRREETAVHVRRLHVFEDSFRELFRRTPEEWKNRFYIVFEEEEGQDAGGLLREWYVIISRDIFNPMYALFTVSPGDRVTYMINSASHYNSNHLCYYKFVGRVIAKAIYDNKLLECYFTRSFYKHILGIPVKYTDMESEDYTFYRGLIYLMENNIKNLGLDLMFSTEISEFGVTETRDLIPDGRHIPVLEENKMDYIRLVCQMKMTGEIKQQLTAFLEGFYDIIPMRLISIFNEQELELLISGLPNVDIDDLKANTEYHKYQSNSLQIQWFWRALRSFDQADRAKFLQFVTGTSKVPLQGFGALEGMNGVQKFQIHRDDRSTDRLPSAHTCFNQLDLPVYETYDKLRAYLLKAIHECSEGFGFA
ncbi:unnamed protein product [Ceutorhynchus assimilis]|uniref:HECT-type E3 ubiquitin transferase n=1 Tax=Ceutorhynchus assimilis TaxID=467358 RepID=A0A9P0DG65_9CUCU|nr:unnamed protein product [Ceutorhynchus assimilis]